MASKQCTKGLQVKYKGHRYVTRRWQCGNRIKEESIHTKCYLHRAIARLCCEQCEWEKGW